MKIVLGERHVWKGVGSKRRYKLKTDMAIYIPVLLTLECLLNNEAILSEVCDVYIAM